MKTARTLSFLVTLFCALPLPAQTAGPVCVVFPVKDLSPGGETHDYEQTITEAVSASLTAGGFTVLPASSWRDAAASRSVDLTRPVSEPDALDIARTVGAALTVTGLYVVQGDEIYYSIQCWNVSSERLAAGVQSRTPFNLAFFSQLNISLSSDLIPRITGSAPQKPGVVFVSRDEGMRVKLSDDLDIGRITEGRLTFPADSILPGTKVVLAKSKPGYHPGEQTVTLSPGKDVALSPLVREHRYGVEVNWTFGQLLGAGLAARLYLVPDWSFLVFGDYLWLQPPLNVALRFIAHNDLYAGFGSYVILKPDAPVRLGISSGAGLIVSVPTAQLGPFGDLYLDVFNWWLEAGFPGTTVYIRMELKYALGNFGGLLGQGWMIKDFPPTTMGVLFKW